MATFQNPSNGHTEDVGIAPVFLTLVFGIFYFMAKGLWRHVLIIFGIAVAAFALFGEPGTMFVILTHLIYTFLAPSLIRSQYLRNGWVETTSGSASQGSLVVPAAKPAKVHYVNADEKVCPECAESVKAAAKVCRFCRHDFTTGTAV